MTAHSLGSLSRVNSFGGVKAALLFALVFVNNALSAGKCFCTSVLFTSSCADELMHRLQKSRLTSSKRL